MASFSMSATATDLNQQQQQQQQQHPPLSSSSTTTAATITNESNTLRNDNNSSTSNNDNDLGQNHQGVIRYGKCKWFNVEKGWGFITPLDGGTEVFVHQSVIQMTGFRSLGEQEEVEFECKLTERGLEATRVSGHLGIDCHGSTYRPRTKKRFVRRVRCYNCGEFANHIAADCSMGPQPKRCHHCRQLDHLFVDCPQRHEEERQQSLQPHRRAPVGQQQQQQRQLPQLPDTVQFS